MSSYQSQEFAQRPQSGLGPDRSVADLYQQEIDEDPDLRGQYIRFRIEVPQGCLLDDLAVGQDRNQCVIGAFIEMPAPAVHLGFRTGMNHLRARLKSLEVIGINHVALKLRFNQAVIETTLQRLADELLPDFPG